MRFSTGGRNGCSAKPVVSTFTVAHCRSGIDDKGKGQCLLLQLQLEIPELCKTGTQLSKYRRPADSGRLSEGGQAVR
jgi:hypothetical protein